MVLIRTSFAYRQDTLYYSATRLTNWKRPCSHTPHDTALLRKLPAELIAFHSSTFVTYVQHGYEHI